MLQDWTGVLHRVGTAPQEGSQTTRTDVPPAGGYDDSRAFFSCAISARERVTDQVQDASLTSKVKAEADNIRVNAPKWFQSEATLRAAYLANPTPGNYASLQAVLTEIQAALTVASQYLTTATTH